MKLEYDLVVIGSGPAGIMAAITAAKYSKEAGRSIRVAIVDSNKSIGKKLSITGGGRCNVTNDQSMEVFFERTVNNPRFLYSAFDSFDNRGTLKFLKSIGVDTIVEHDNDQKVYIRSGYSQELISALEKELFDLGVELILNNKVNNIELDGMYKVVYTDEHIIRCNNLIIATGGVSFPKTGSDGSMYGILSKLGYDIKRLHPALVPIVCEDGWIRNLSGTSVKGIRLDVMDMKKKKPKKVVSLNGDMIFTHKGLGGPVILKASSYINKDISRYVLKMDFVPEISRDEIIGLIKNNHKKSISNILSKILPSRLSKEILSEAGKIIDRDLCEVDISNMDRKSLDKVLDLIKDINIKPIGLMSIDVATVTSGGLSVKQVNPSTMESKLHNGIYFAGEMIDVDALSGGFNIQIALSTGYLAGKSSAESIL